MIAWVQRWWRWIALGLAILVPGLGYAIGREHGAQRERERTEDANADALFDAANQRTIDAQAAAARAAHHVRETLRIRAERDRAIASPPTTPAQAIEEADILIEEAIEFEDRGTP